MHGVKPDPEREIVCEPDEASGFEIAKSLLEPYPDTDGIIWNRPTSRILRRCEIAKKASTNAKPFTPSIGIRSCCAMSADFSGSRENTPATSWHLSSMRIAMRWVSPMPAPGPPPTIPTGFEPSCSSNRPCAAIRNGHRTLGFAEGLCPRRAVSCQTRAGIQLVET